MFSIPKPSDFNEWRDQARQLLKNRIHPQELIWQKEQEPFSLFSNPLAASTPSADFKVSREFIKRAQTVSCHRSGDQWALLYSILWRIHHGEKHLLQITSDSEVRKIDTFVKQIRRDCHKMHAFVRFRKISQCPQTKREQFFAWFEPDHKILRLNASFFRKRFFNMDWSILTPDECMHWQGESLHYTPGVSKEQAPDSDALEELWKSYYKSIFNVARVKVKAMQAEMPKKYWKNLPEAELISSLLTDHQAKVQDMIQRPCSPEKAAPPNLYLQKLHEENSQKAPKAISPE